MAKKCTKLVTLIIGFTCLFNLIGNSIIVKAEIDTEYAIGDLNKDRLIDILDLSYLASAYNYTESSPHWKKGLDLNNDKIIDLYDIVIVSKLISSEQYSDEEVYNTAVTSSKVLHIMVQSAYAKIGFGTVNLGTINIIENYGFYDYYENVKFVKDKIPDTSEFKVYYDRIYEIYDSVNSNIISYSETKDENCFIIIKAKFDDCETLVKELEEMQSGYLFSYVESIVKELIMIQEVYEAKFGDKLGERYITNMESLGFYSSYENAKELKNKLNLDESLKVYIDNVYKICDSINSNIILYKETKDESYLKLIRERFKECYVVLAELEELHKSS